MNREFIVQYEMYEAEGEIRLSVTDKENGEVLNLFKGKMAENIYKMLSGDKTNKLSLTDCKREDALDDTIKEELEKGREEIISKLKLIMEAENITKEFIKKTFDEIREIVDYLENLLEN